MLEFTLQIDDFPATNQVVFAHNCNIFCGGCRSLRPRPHNLPPFPVSVLTANPHRSLPPITRRIMSARVRAFGDGSALRRSDRIHERDTRAGTLDLKPGRATRLVRASECGTKAQTMGNHVIACKKWMAVAAAVLACLLGQRPRLCCVSSCGDVACV